MLPKRKPNRFSQITPYVMAFTGLAYIVMGGFVIKRQWLLVPLTEVMSYAMGILLMIYGAFRGWRAYQALSESSQE